MSGLARALLQAGRLSAPQIESLTRQATSEGNHFIDVLLISGAIDARSLAAFCSDTFGYPLLDVSAFNLASLPEKVIDVKLMQSQRVIALGKRGNRLAVAISDPTNLQALDQIKFQTEMTSSRCATCPAMISTSISVARKPQSRSSRSRSTMRRS
jgi:type IV pilus assembly protein PilB